MKTQILPNWCKKLGVAMFIVFSFISGGDDFLNGFFDGFNGLPYNSETSDSVLFLNYFSESVLHLFSIISMLGVLIYILSKEKIEDDYIAHLRLESFQLTAIIGLVVSILLYSLSEDMKLTLDYFIFLSTWCYLIIFFIKKRLY